jgi:opacity protein-like surface antigen
MKKLLVVMLAMAIAISFGSMAMAKNGLSVELGLAYNPNGAVMGASFLNDGEEGAGNSLFGDVILSENTFLALKKTKNNPLGISPIKSATDDGAMSGLNTNLRVRYDFLDAFFVRLGFVYDKQISGGDDSFKLTDNALILNSLVAAQTGNANELVAASSLAGKKITQEWTYGYWAIPVTVGINVPVTEKFNLYAGLGLTYYSGYWQLKVKAPAGYIAGDTSLGDANEKCKFEASGIGINWTVGASVAVYQDISLFLEIDTTMAAGMSDSEKLKSDGGKGAFGVDNLYYPVNLSTQLIRFGASYKLPLEI